MPKSVPSLNQQNWGQPLNDHLGQLNDPVTGGINIWNDAAGRPWADGDTTKDDFVGRTGYNRETGSFERWEISPSPRWITLQKAIAPSAYRGPGRAQLAYDTTGEYFFLYNNQTDVAQQLGEIVEIGFIIDVGFNNTSFQAQYIVIEIIDSNRVRVNRVNQKFNASAAVDYLPSSTSPVITNLTQADFFRVGDNFQGGFVDANNNKVIDGGGVIVGKNSPTEYINNNSTFHNNQRTVFFISRGPGVTNSYPYQIYEPTIKYTNDAGQDVFTIDNNGSTRINHLNAQNDDNLILTDNPPVLSQRIIRSNDSFSRSTDELTISARYAIRTGESYTNHSGIGINGYRVLGSEIYPSASTDPNDWAGNNGSNPAALTLRGGIQSKDFPATIEQDAWNGMIIRQSYASGKINKFYAIRIWVVASSGGASTPMDELWGIYESGHTSGMTGGEVASKNYFQGNLGLGTTNGNDTGNQRLVYTDIDEKLCVYGNVAVRAAGSVPGNITHAGTITQSSDARLKENISPLLSTEVLEKIQQIEAKRYNLKADEAKKTRFGFIAQELEKVFPELVSTGADEMKTVNYVDMIPLLTEALKAQQEQITKLQTRLDELEK